MSKTREEYAKEQGEAFGTVRIPKSLHKKFKMACARKGIKMHWQAEQLISDYLRSIEDEKDN